MKFDIKSKTTRNICICCALSVVIFALYMSYIFASNGQHNTSDASDTQTPVSSIDARVPTAEPTNVPTGESVDLSMFAIEPRFMDAGLFDSEGYAIVYEGDPEVYDYEQEMRSSFYGVINEKGEYVLPPIYDLLYEYYGNYYASGNKQETWISKSGEYCLANKQYQLIYVPDIEEVGYFGANGRSMVKMDGKWGIINGDGKMIIEPLYDEILECGSGEIAYGVSVNDLWGFINEVGDMVIEPQYTYIESGFEDGNIIISRDGKWGVINENGETIIEPDCEDRITNSVGGVAVFDRTDASGITKYGIINTNGEVIVEPRYDSIYVQGTWDEALLTNWNGIPFLLSEIINEGDYYYKCGLISITGEVLAEPQYEMIDIFTANHLARVQKDGKYGFINEDGKVVIDCKYDYATNFDENGLAQITEYGIFDTWGIIDSEGKWVLDPEYDVVGEFAPNGLASVMLDGKCGYINTSGEFVIEPQFDWAQKFEENGLAEVKIDGKIGYINETGEYVIAPQFQTDMGEWSANGTIFVMQNGKWGLIDKKGEFLIQPRFDGVSISVSNEYWSGQPVLHDFAVVEENGKYGLASLDGRILLEPISESANIGISPNGMIPVAVNGKWGYIQIEM